jgi:hypothetical protein
MTKARPPFRVPAAEGTLLLRMLAEGYRRTAWHGPNLAAATRGLSPAQVAFRPGPGRHNIWEETVHAAYWKHIAAARLTGDRRPFPVRGSNWFASPPSITAKDWAAARALLRESDAALAAAVEALPRTGSRLDATRRFDLLLGIACHDAYHAGQIQLLRRMGGQAGAR